MELRDHLGALRVPRGDALGGGDRGRDVLNANGEAIRDEPPCRHLRQAV